MVYRKKQTVSEILYIVYYEDLDNHRHTRSRFDTVYSITAVDTIFMKG